MDVIIKTQIDGSIKKFSCSKLLAMRKLSQREMRFLRQSDIKRLYLPSLNDNDCKEFLTLFDTFWNELVKNYPRDHFFWRNAISSKMQEWEHSLSYLLMGLFTLNKKKDFIKTPLLIVTSSFQEAQVCHQWALANEWNILSSNGIQKSIFSFIRQELKNFIGFIRIFLISCRKKFYSPKRKYLQDRLQHTKQTLMATLAYPASFEKDGYRDPFFGNLEEYLKSSGSNSFYLADLLANYDSETSGIVEQCQGNNIELVCSILSWKELIGALLRVWFRKIKVSSVKFLSIEMNGLVEWNSRRATHHFNVMAEFFYVAVKKVCSEKKFDHLILIYEGNVFERGVIQGYRECSTGSVCGYSHGVIFEINLKLRLTEQELNNRPEPDYFVCSGSLSKTLLKNMGVRSSNQVLEGCALRKVPSIKRPIQKIVSKNILVTLDGFWTSNRLLDWLIDNKDAFDGYEVVLRCHPNVELKRILLQTINKLPESFRISEASLDEEICQSMCVLYRHTSVGMQALLNGVPAIYLAIDSPMSGDPINDLKIGKRVAHDRDELKQALLDVQKENAEDTKALLDHAESYVREYFGSPTEDRVKQFFGE